MIGKTYCYQPLTDARRLAIARVSQI